MKPDIIDELFSKYYNDAFLYTLSLCRNREVAEDVVSTAFYRALSLADDTISNFKPWLLTVCRNEFLSICRKNSRFTGEEIPESLADESESAADAVIRTEEYRALYHAIGLLKADQKEAILLFYFSGLAGREIAEVMGKSEAAVKVLLHRGRESLRKILEENI